MHIKNKLKIIPLLLAGIVGTSLLSNAQGIEFIYDLDSALAKAKAEDKIVFIDFYTSWCAPSSGL